MPCWTKTEYESVKLDNTDSITIHQALANLGQRPVTEGAMIRFATGTYDERSGILQTTDPTVEQKIKAACARVTVLQQSNRHGWKVVKPQTAQTVNRY